MPKNKRMVKERFFTIKTNKKDHSILDKFTDEFGYAAFEAEERSDDSRRSIKQISNNDELTEEVADFCKENSCAITLIYKEKGILMEKLFRGKQICKEKKYGDEDPAPVVEVEYDKSVASFINNKKINNHKPKENNPYKKTSNNTNNKSSNKSSNNTKNKTSNNNNSTNSNPSNSNPKRTQQKRKTTHYYGVMSDSKPREVQPSNRADLIQKQVSDVSITTRKKRTINKP